MSEWLGTGLQNRLHQFESGWNLRYKGHVVNPYGLFVVIYVYDLYRRVDSPVMR